MASQRGLGLCASLALLAWGCTGDDAASSGAWNPDLGSTSAEPMGSSGLPPGSTGGFETGVDGSDESGPTPEPDLPEIDDCPRVRVVVAPGEVLNLRPDPSTANPPIGALPNGSIVPVLEEVEGESIDGDTRWFRVDHFGTEGYVSAVFAECTTDEAPELMPPDGFYLPLECGMQAVITQGNNGELTHNGLHAYAFDFGIGLDTPLVAMADGIVSLIYADTMPGDPCYAGGGPECGPYGNLVILLHGDGSTSLYKHLNEVHVAPGEFVSRGLPVGLSGSTGYSTGRHAHVMRMENCGQLTCQSIPLEFVEAGVPVTGDLVTSENCP